MYTLCARLADGTPLASWPDLLSCLCGITGVDSADPDAMEKIASKLVSASVEAVIDPPWAIDELPELAPDWTIGTVRYRAANEEDKEGTE